MRGPLRVPGSLGFRVVDMSDSPTCWGRGAKTPNKVQPAVAWESNTLTPRKAKAIVPTLKLGLQPGDPQTRVRIVPIHTHPL